MDNVILFDLGPLQQVGYRSTVQRGYPRQGYGAPLQGDLQQQAGYGPMPTWQQHYAGGSLPQQQLGYGTKPPLQQGSLPPVG